MGAKTKAAVGRRGEDLAAAELERRGMRILDRNWRCRWGELDIIAVEGSGSGQTIVFCEVKCRTGLGFGDPLESITHTKLRRLRRLSAEWLAGNGPPAAGIRLDAVGVVLAPGAEPRLSYVPGIG